LFKQWLGENKGPVSMNSLWLQAPELCCSTILNNSSHRSRHQLAIIKLSSLFGTIPGELTLEIANVCSKKSLANLAASLKGAWRIAHPIYYTLTLQQKQEVFTWAGSPAGASTVVSFW
jgi:hypothetical protein